MTTATLAGRDISVDEEGFMTEPGQWDRELAGSLAEMIGIELSEEHFKALEFARADFAENGQTPTLRRMAAAGGMTTKDMFRLFPKKPAKKMAYVAGLPKPVGCV